MMGFFFFFQFRKNFYILLLFFFFFRLAYVRQFERWGHGRFVSVRIDCCNKTLVSAYSSCTR